jgi:hypothetical protein
MRRAGLSSPLRPTPVPFQHETPHILWCPELSMARAPNKLHLRSNLLGWHLPPGHCSTWSPPQPPDGGRQIAEKMQSAGGPGEHAQCVHARSLYAVLAHAVGSGVERPASERSRTPISSTAAELWRRSASVASPPQKCGHTPTNVRADGRPHSARIDFWFRAVPPSDMTTQKFVGRSGCGLGGLPVAAYGVPPQRIAERMQSVGDPGGVSQDVRRLERCQVATNGVSHDVRPGHSWAYGVSQNAPYLNCQRTSAMMQ